MYYPKALILTDLYTNGTEYVDLGGKVYVGYYWKTYDGRIISGKNPEDKTGGLALLPINPQLQPSQIPPVAASLQATITDASLEYNSLKRPDSFETFIPYSVITPPTDVDYEIGSFTRYFCKRTNGEVYLEIDQDQFNKLSRKADDILWQLYTPFSMFWKLTGDREQVFQTNKNLTQQIITTKKYYRFADFLKNQYLLYYKG